MTGQNDHTLHFWSVARVPYVAGIVTNLLLCLEGSGNVSKKQQKHHLAQENNLMELSRQSFRCVDLPMQEWLAITLELASV